MNKLFLIFVFTFNQVFSFSQENAKITFKVANVSLAENSLYEVSYKKAFEHRIKGKIESYDISNKNKTLIETHNNAFVVAVHYAYATHRPLVISPDMIWLLIEQGFAFHINYYKDSLQSQIVNFKGKKKISVKNNNFIKGNESNNWANEISKFSSEIKKYIGNDLHSVLVPNFSTTTINEKIAFEVTLMDAVEEYFEFSDMTFCGIPEITLEGKTKDWEKLYANTQKLKKYNLEKWVNKLNPILKEFINTSKGNINKEFWNSIYKLKTEYNAGYINGWIINFFPYLNNGKCLIENALINKPNNPKAYIKSNELTQGISKVPFTWLHIPDNKTYNMEFYAGFIGIKQDTISMSLRPEIAWAVIDTKGISYGKYRFSEFYGFIPDTIFDRMYNNDSIFTDLEYQAEFPGGEMALSRFVRKKINSSFDFIKGDYPIKLEIKKDGSVGKIEIENIKSKKNKQEIIEVLKNLPKFHPSKKNGNDINSWYKQVLIL